MALDPQYEIFRDAIVAEALTLPPTRRFAAVAEALNECIDILRVPPHALPLAEALRIIQELAVAVFAEIDRIDPAGRQI